MEADKNIEFLRVDPDEGLVLEFKTDFKIRHAIQLPTDKKIVVTDKLFSYQDFVFNPKKNRVSFVVSEKTSYAYYKITPRILANIGGVSIGTIIGVIIAAKLIAVSSIIAAALGTKVISIALGTLGAYTGQRIANFLANQIPVKVVSTDITIDNFRTDFLLANKYNLSNLTEYDFVDRDSVEYSFRKSLQELKKSTEQGLKSTFNLLNFLSENGTLILLGGIGYAIYKKTV